MGVHGGVGVRLQGVGSDAKAMRSLADLPDLDVVNPHGGADQKAKPAFNGMCKAFRLPLEYRGTVNARAYLFALGHQSQVVPLRVGLPGNAGLFQRMESSRCVPCLIRNKNQEVRGE